MTQDQIAVFAIISITIALFIWDRWRYDIIAIGALFLSVIVGVVPANKAFTGFSDPVVVTVACILVLSASISRSGFIDMALRLLNRFVERPYLQVVVLSAMVMVLSAFMNNVGALAVFLPVAITFAKKAGRKPSELLMPMSFASLLGGLVTLIGTPPNLMIGDIRRQFTGESYAMFDFAPVGLGICAVGLVYLAFGWRLLPKDRLGRALPEDQFSIEDYTSEVLVGENSPFIGKSIREIEVSMEEDFTIIAVPRSGFLHRFVPSDRVVIQKGDILLIKTDPLVLKKIIDTGDVTLVGSKDLSEGGKVQHDFGIAEAVVTNASELVGSTLKELFLRRRFGVNVLAVRQRGATNATQRINTVRFTDGDIIVLQGNLETMTETIKELGCLPLAERNLQLGRPKRVFLPPAIMGVAVLLSVFNVLPISIAFLGAVIALILLKVMRPNEVYGAIDAPILILLGAMIPVTQAMQDTGGAALIAEAVAGVTGGMAGMAVLAIVMVATMIVTPFLNNAATVLLMAPIAGNLAVNMDMKVDAFFMAVAVGASCDFLTPIGHQSNTLVMGPGGYKFGDYWRLGLPLSVLVVLVGTPLIAMVWPLH